MLTIVIARDTENLAWLDRLPVDARIYVYNRGPDLAAPPWQRGDVRVVSMAGGDGIAGAYLQHLSLHHDESVSGHTVFAPGDALRLAPALTSSVANSEAWGPVQMLSRAERFSLHTWAPLADATRPQSAQALAYRRKQGLGESDSLSVQVLADWGLEHLAMRAASADLGVFAPGPVLAVDNKRINLIRRALAAQHEAAMARLLRAARVDAAWFDLAFERLALHFFGEPFVRCSALVLSSAPDKETHMQASLSSAKPSLASPAAVMAAAPSEAMRLLAQARNAAYAEAAQGRLGQGLTLLHEALQHEPMSHDLMSDMAALLLAAGEFEHAAAYAQRALEVTPFHGPSLYTLGFALVGLSETGRAAEALTRVTQGEALSSLLAEAPDLLPLVQIELVRLQALVGQGSQAFA